MNKYQHSVTFARLKDIKESLPGNLTSFQYMSLLDSFLWKGLQTFYRNYQHFTLNFAAKVVAQQYLSFSLRHTRTDVTELPLHMFNLALTKDEEHLNKLEFNRGIIFSLLQQYLDITDAYVRSQSVPFATLSFEKEFEIQQKMQTILAVDDVQSIYSVHKEIRKHFDDAKKFKGQINEKYVRLAMNAANSTYRKFNHTIDQDDIIMLYLVHLSRAIDRVNINKGVLTTFIQQTLLTAYGTLKKQANEQLESSYDEALEEGIVHSYEESDETHASMQLLVQIAKRFDPDGLVRFELKLPEVLSKDDVATLKLLERKIKKNAI